MEIIAAHSAKYNRDGTIDCIVEFNNNMGEGPYTASPIDSAPHCCQLFSDLEEGKYGLIEAYTTENQKKDSIIDAEFTRSGLIEEANSVILLLSDEREAGIISNDDLARWVSWVAYRKALRYIDITADDIRWPAKPE